MKPKVTVGGLYRFEQQVVTVWAAAPGSQRWWVVPSGSRAPVTAHSRQLQPLVLGAR